MVLQVALWATRNQAHIGRQSRICGAVHLKMPSVQFDGALTIPKPVKCQTCLNMPACDTQSRAMLYQFQAVVREIRRFV